MMKAKEKVMINKELTNRSIDYIIQHFNENISVQDVPIIFISRNITLAGPSRR